MRRKILRWILKSIGYKEGRIMKWYEELIVNIFFPMRYFYLKQSGIKYDFVHDIYTIEGVRFSGGMIYALATMEPGTKFEFVKMANDAITIKILPNEKAMESCPSGLRKQS